MTHTDWLPGLVVLALGLFAAVVVLLVGRRRGRPAAAEGRRAGALKAADEAELRASRLLDQLRELESDRHQLSSEAYQEESRRLELLAADALRARDEARLTSGKARRPGPTAQVPTPAGLFARHPQLTGALWGAGLVAFFGALGLWLSHDAKPRTAADGITGTAGREEAPPSPEPEDPAFTAALARVHENPDDVQTAGHVAHELIRRQDYDEAKQLTDQSLGVDPFQSEARVHRAFLLAVGGDEPAALRELQHLSELYPNSSEAFLFLGMMRMRSGDNAAAADAFERFMAETPQDEQPPQMRAALTALLRQLKGQR
ncbi:MAG: tetratricopeptide repeat protein [Myxococcaceae bacterium]